MLLERFILLLAVAVSVVTAQTGIHSDGTLGSCAEVECPTDPGPSVANQCIVGNRTYMNLGIDSFGTELAGDMAWTQATQIFDGHNQRIVEKDFWLGTPSSLNLSDNGLGFRGCAVFLYNLAKQVPDKETTISTASSLAGDQCLSDTINDTKNFTTTLLRSMRNDGTNPEERICQRLEERFRDFSELSCEPVINKTEVETGVSGWGQGVHARPLTGALGPKALSASQNQSRNCQPTLPKTNDLAFAFGYNNTGTYYADSTLQMINSVNFVVTVLYPDKTEQLGADEVEVHMSCLWPVQRNLAEEANMATSNAGSLRGRTWSSTVLFLTAVLHLS